MQGFLRKLTQRLDVRSEGRRLMLSRKRAGYLLGLALTAAACLVVLFLCLRRVPAGGAAHARSIHEMRVSAFSLLPVCVGFLVFGLSRLRPQVWDFDLGTGQILFNGALVCAVGEIRSVHVDDDYFAGECQVLYLRKKTQTNIPVVNDSTFGVSAGEMGEKARLVSAHLGVALVLKDEYVPGHPDVASRRWGGKGQRRGQTRRPKRGAA